MAKLLVIDNYDSFTFNLVQMFRQYPLDISVFRGDQIDVKQARNHAPDYLLISPGPKDPANAGMSMKIIEAFCGKIPILGVCLGMQCINEVFGGKTVRAPIPMHGKTSLVEHAGKGIFQNVPSPFCAARYHSLMTQFEMSALAVTARSDDGVIMGLSLEESFLHGVQFHPESFLTDHGYEMVENFLKLGPVSDPCRIKATGFGCWSN